MATLLSIHPHNPQKRLIVQVLDVLQKNAVVVLPTDSGYSLCCRLGQVQPVQRIRQIRDLEDRHYFTLLCRDFSQVASYARVNNASFRFLKAHTPASITCIFAATREVPKRLLHPKRRTIGIRIPQNEIILALLGQLQEPLMSVSVDEFPDQWPLLDPYEIAEHYHGQVEMVVDGGVIAVEPTTVVDLMADQPQVVRQGSYKVC